MTFKKGVQKKGREIGLKKIAEKKALERSIKPVMTVKTVEEALSDRVINFSVQHLSTGGTWNELRKKLNLGPAWEDARWRKLRRALLDAALPESEEEALKSCYARSEFLMMKLERLVKRIEDEVERGTEKNIHLLLKTQLDGLKVLAEQNDKEFMNYLEMKKLKVVDSKSQGTSIIFQNNYYVPRPGDKDVTPKAKVIDGE